MAAPIQLHFAASNFTPTIKPYLCSTKHKVLLRLTLKKIERWNQNS